MSEEVTQSYTSRGTFLNRDHILVAVTVFIGFLVTSTGWLSWEYHMLTQLSSEITEICAMVVGYLIQSAGIGLYALVLKNKPQMAVFFSAIGLVLHMLCMIPAVLSPYAAGTLIFGFLMNLWCGVIAGRYLYDLSRVSSKRRATVFGMGYALSILASWLLSTVGGRIYYSDKVLVICLILTVAAYFLTREDRGGALSGGYASDADLAADDTDNGRSHRGLSIFALSCILVVLFSLINSSGFSFPAADIKRDVDVELLRLIYAVGLIIAGCVSDRSRKYGAICALTALILPFIILALRERSVSAVIFWLLSYFTFGFYSVYRIILFFDIACEKGLIYLSGFGLMLGRIGDALGEWLCVALTRNPVALIVITAVLFAMAVLIFFKLYPVLYMEQTADTDEREKFYRFASEHDLSSRERELLRLMLDEKTNSEIAETLCISENTVKFHAKNLFQKTGAKNRGELMSVFYSR